jgi:endonuclease-8
MDQKVIAGVGNVYRAEVLFGLDPLLPGRGLRREQWDAVWADVYRRTGDPCLVCGTPVARETHLARNLFWCPSCQPAAA